MKFTQALMVGITLCIVLWAANVAAQTQTNTFPPSGNVGIGTPSPGANLDIESLGNAQLQVGTQSGYTLIRASSYDNTDWAGSFWNSIRGRGTMTSPTSVQAGDTLGAFDLWGFDGSANQRSAQINATVGATPSAGIVPGQINFEVANASGSMITPFYLNSSGNGLFTGNVGIGTNSPAAKLDVNGSINISGAGAGIMFPNGGGTQSVAWTGVLCGGDYAESVDVSGERAKYAPGDVLVIGAESGSDVAKSSEPYSTLVLGVYATKPGVVGRRQTTDAKSNTTEVPMAMVGIVPTKVSGENGPITRGDLLVTSSTIGYAMKGTDRSRMLGAVIGKALGNLDSGTGVIEVAITLQ